MKITDLKCMVISDLRALLVRIDTDEGVSGLAQVEASKHSYLKPHVLFYKRYILGQDPTNVERVMLRIRRLGAFKPWGSSVSAIEMALWDIAGKVAGVP
ncbi:MAG: mandelate racemase/muconate lactonizing enzyme family protein, partial [Candidatus Bathyarchaeota archaeon]|nr:mandelate racemase/muconate lactonizing enzyme family protein [Candidatus Bathyarchaeota archaeon]